MPQQLPDLVGPRAPAHPPDPTTAAPIQVGQLVTGDPGASDDTTDPTGSVVTDGADLPALTDPDDDALAHAPADDDDTVSPPTLAVESAPASGPGVTPPSGPESARRHTGSARRRPGSAPRRPRASAPAVGPTSARPQLSISLSGRKMKPGERLRGSLRNRTHILRPTRDARRNRRPAWLSALAEGRPESFAAHARYVNSRSWVPPRLDDNGRKFVSAAGWLLGYFIGSPLTAIGLGIAAIGQRNGRILIALVLAIAGLLAFKYGR